MGRWSRVLLLVLCSWLPAPWSAAAEPGPFASAMPGEQVIVKFVAGSEAARAVAAALAHGLEGSAEIAALAATLSNELEIPIRIERVTSGQELLLAIDLAALSDRLWRYFEAHDEVLRVHPLDALATPERLYRRLGVRLELRPDSRSQRALAEPPAAAADAPVLRELTDGASQALGVPLSATATATLDVALDVEALMETLVRRLNARADVEYAEEDRLVQPLGGADD